MVAGCGASMVDHILWHDSVMEPLGNVINQV